MRIISTFLVVVTFNVFCLFTAQSQERPAYGIFGDYNLNSYSADFRNFPNVPSCCPKYQDGSGSGFTVGILYELPLADQLRLALRAGYSTRSGMLKRDENTTVTGNIPAVFEHRVDVTLADIGIEPILQYNPFGALWINLGGRIAMVSTKNFSQKETIITPTDGVLPNGSSTRNEYSDQPIPDGSSIFAAALGGISYDLPLNAKGTFVLAPEVLYSLGITPVVSGLSWSSNTLRIGLALKYSPLPSKDPVERIEHKHRIDTIRRESPIAVNTIIIGKESISTQSQVIDDELLITNTHLRTDTLLIPKNIETPITNQIPLAANVSASGVEASGMEKQTVKLQVEEFSSVLMTPLLNYVFFDENSSSIPTRYKSLNSNELTSFNEKKINDANRLSTYYHILNIIGKRMEDNPKSTITLIGCNADIGAEKSNLALSQQRAESVKDYLARVWKIDGGRMKIESRNLPEKAAQSQTEDGFEENRRVEIIASTATVIAPIITNDTLRKANPPTVRFRPQITGSAPVAQWSLTAEQNGKILKRFEGTGTVPNTIDWNMDQDGTHPRTEEGLKYTLTVKDSEGASVSAGSIIPVEQNTIRRKQLERKGDKEINRYSLILFDIRSSEITGTNKPIIELIRKGITPTSTVNVAGYTDRLGDARTNQSLAEGRAKATANALNIPENGTNISSKGNAETYNPKLPEGRLYTRNGGCGDRDTDKG
ncbi:MAG: OmpA family protein [Ignavibacteria bacterium]|nr:OmpA family protein [Ignavibacteria bacterium]